MTSPTQFSRATRAPKRLTHSGRDVARVDLHARTDARSVIRQLGRLARAMPDRIGVVEVYVDSVDDLTVELLTGIAISRRLLGAGGRLLVLRVPGLPTTLGSTALLGTMPFTLISEQTECA